MRPRLKAVGFAAMTLVTVGGLARARKRARVRESENPFGATVQIRPIAAPRFTSDQHQFLSEASALLASSLDYEKTVDRVASLGASFFADWCAVYIAGTNGNANLVKAAHGEPLHATLAERFERFANEAERPAVVQRTIDTRQAALVPHVSAEHLAFSLGPELDLMKQLHIESLMIVPLVARDRSVGAMVFGSTNPRRAFTDATLPIARELGRRAAMAVLNAEQYRDAEAAIAARDEILAVVAHDLRTPLHVIEFAAERLREEGHGPHRRSADRSLDWIVNAAQRATILVRDLLDRARLEWQASALNLAAVSPSDVLRDVADRAEAMAMLASLRLHVRVAPDLTPALADRERIVQALENLIGNAIKFTPPGGSVSVGAEPHEEGVRFYVSDTGEGIDPDDLDRIFDRFWKARDADSRGAGLGLSICKRIVEAHGGRLWVESRVGEGTTVSFTIGTANS
jgi:signal transduction histidine kinase